MTNPHLKPVLRIRFLQKRGCLYKPDTLTNKQRLKHYNTLTYRCLSRNIILFNSFYRASPATQTASAARHDDVQPGCASQKHPCNFLQLWRFPIPQLLH